MSDREVIMAWILILVAFVALSTRPEPAERPPDAVSEYRMYPYKYFQTELTPSQVGQVTDALTMQATGNRYLKEGPKMEVECTHERDTCWIDGQVYYEGTKECTPVATQTGVIYEGISDERIYLIDQGIRLEDWETNTPALRIDWPLIEKCVELNLYQTLTPPSSFTQIEIKWDTVRQCVKDGGK